MEHLKHLDLVDVPVVNRPGQTLRRLANSSLVIVHRLNVVRAKLKIDVGLIELLKEAEGASLDRSLWLRPKPANAQAGLAQAGQSLQVCLGPASCNADNYPLKMNLRFLLDGGEKSEESFTICLPLGLSRLI